MNEYDVKPMIRSGKTNILTNEQAYHEIYKCEIVLKNVADMLTKRKYTNIEIVKNIDEVLSKIFLFEDENYCTPVLSAKTEDNKDCLVFISSFLKIRVSNIRDFAIELKKYNNNYIAIALTSAPANPTALTEIEKQKLNLQILTFDDMSRCVLNHKLMPSYQKLMASEVQSLLKNLGLTSVDKLPKIQSTDYVVKYFGFELGAVLKKQIRNNIPSYRVVI